MSCKSNNKQKYPKAICVLNCSQLYSIDGAVSFTEYTKYVKVEVDLIGVPPGTRGFHIHEKGNLSEGCTSVCSHFNPHGAEHGGLNEPNSHLGDLGNLEADSQGKIKKTFHAKRIRLTGQYSIIGRALVIHEKADDLGKGGNPESKKTGNAGKRIACGVIGIN
jgi:Cu-Zn family superoxide dismutase